MLSELARAPKRATSPGPSFLRVSSPAGFPSWSIFPAMSHRPHAGIMVEPRPCWVENQRQLPLNSTSAMRARLDINRFGALSIQVSGPRPCTSKLQIWSILSASVWRRCLQWKRKNKIPGTNPAPSRPQTMVNTLRKQNINHMYTKR